MAEKDKEKNKKREKTKDNIIRRIMQGRLVSSSFFIRHWVMIALCLVIAIIYISTKYSCQIKMQKIITLTRELNNVKTDYVKAASEYKSQTRETRMRALLDTTRIELTTPNQPPYTLPGK